MMRPMKLAGSQLIFGEGSLAHLATLEARKVAIILSSPRLKESKMWSRITDPLEASKIKHTTFIGVEPEPHFSTVKKGAAFLLQEKPDFILAIGGGSVMDAAKCMWVLYEKPEITSLGTLEDKEQFPTLRKKAHFGCIPSTSGSASEVSRSIVIADDETGYKHGIGNMEMMPDLAICDPVLTLSMPPYITATTGMDALTHALEAIVSRRANYIANILSRQAALDIFKTLPTAHANGTNMEAREIMLNASTVAGLAFTNVSLGIVHSIAHSCGSIFHLPHGLLNAIILPWIVEFNSTSARAAAIYTSLAEELGANSLQEAIRKLGQSLGIPTKLSEVVEAKKFEDTLNTLISLSLADGCTKTNPIIPDRSEMEKILKTIYYGT